MSEILAIQNGLTVVTSVVFSGLVATVVSQLLHRKFAVISVKRDVLRRFVGNRYVLTQQRLGFTGEPFVALNEIFVVYANDAKVIAALTKLHAERQQHNRLEDNLVTLIKSMAKAAKIQIRELDDYFIMNPFTPPKTG